LTDAPATDPTFGAMREEWRAWPAEHRDRRLAQLIADSAAARRVGPLARAS
jgi:hypothetical protein